MSDSSRIIFQSLIKFTRQNKIEIVGFYYKCIVDIVLEKTFSLTPYKKRLAFAFVAERVWELLFFWSSIKKLEHSESVTIATYWRGVLLNKRKIYKLIEF